MSTAKVSGKVNSRVMINASELKVKRPTLTSIPATAASPTTILAKVPTPTLFSVLASNPFRLLPMHPRHANRRFRRSIRKILSCLCSFLQVCLSCGSVQNLSRVSPSALGGSPASLPGSHLDGVYLLEGIPLWLNERPSMPLLDIAAAQPNFQNHLGALRSQTLKNGRLLPNSCLLGNCKTFSPIWKPQGICKKMRFEIQTAKFAIEAVATLELKCSDSREHMCLDDSPADSESSPLGSPLGSSGGDDLEMDEREKLRRMRISKANKGNTPWNKGRKHSPETLQRIRERTRIAMQDPKVRMKLAKLGHVQTEEARLKISAGVRMGWERRRQMLVVQEICYFEWQNLIAEASRRGYVGEDELQWNSYEMLSEQLKREWIESIEQRKLIPRTKSCRRAPKSLEQRRKIATAIAAKWVDPEYRDRVCSGLAKYHGTDAGGERKPRPRRSPSAITRPRRNSSPKKPRETGNALKRDPTGCIRKAKPKRSNGPLFKDPNARSKLEMIKSIRAQRAASETSTIEAINQARLLITEAERAALALEVAAAKSPIARAALIETWKLITEAIQCIESVETGSASLDATSVPNFQEEGIRIESLSIKLRGTRVHGTVAGVTAWKDKFDFGNLLLKASDSV